MLLCADGSFYAGVHDRPRHPLSGSIRPGRSVPRIHWIRWSVEQSCSAESHRDQTAVILLLIPGAADPDRSTPKGADRR